eukprot:6137334-Prymnesium_polylepis.1
MSRTYVILVRAVHPKLEAQLTHRRPDSSSGAQRRDGRPLPERPYSGASPAAERSLPSQYSLRQHWLALSSRH